MRLWVVRAGSEGQREIPALELGLLLPGFEEVGDLSSATTKDAIRAELEKSMPSASLNRLKNFANQLNQFRNVIAKDDLVVLPRKSALIAIGRVDGDYYFDEQRKHARKVTWLKQDVPRKNFLQDLLYSFGAFMTICEVTRNNALARTQSVISIGQDPGPVAVSKVKSAQQGETELLVAEDVTATNLDELASDQIRQHIEANFAGHGLTRLIAAILEADGYKTFVSPEGPDNGLDIVAGRGSLGVESPRLVVQVKSGNIVADAPTLNALVGNVANLNADHGLLVSWSGFKQTVERQLATKYFSIRLWTSTDVLDAIYRTYENLPEGIRNQPPLKRTWTLVLNSED